MIEGINAGADDYVPKSSDFDVLKARVRAQLRRKQFEDEYRSIREKLLQKELEATQAKASQELAEARATLVDELERKNRELEAFSYSVSHDLRAPLRVINGFAQVLLEDFRDQLPPKCQDYLSGMHDAAMQMSELINALLQLSRLDRAKLKRESIDLSELARTIAADLAQSEPERQVDFVIEDGLAADADPRLVRVVLDNFLGNAWKFTRRTPHARIEVGGVRKGAMMAYFVRDNGAGFNMAYAAKLFAPFQRMHSSAEFPGTGIGLATVHRIIERHGGRVWAEGEVGRGATFSFMLCSDSAPANEKRAESVSTLREASDGR